MNANVNNAEDPLFEGQYEYKGQENYSPTRTFLKKVYLILDIQISIVLALHIIFGDLLNPILPDIWDNLYVAVDVIVFPFILILIFQLYVGSRLKASIFRCLIAMILRTAIFYGVIRVLIPENHIKQLTLFICLILLLHLTLTGYVFCMGKEYKRRIAFVWIAILMALATGFLYLMKDVLVPKIWTHTDISVNVVMVFLYGLYLIYETGFILDGILYQINHHQFVFAAFILQYDVIGLCFWLVQKCHPRGNRRSRRN